MQKEIIIRYCLQSRLYKAHFEQFSIWKFRNRVPLIGSLHVLSLSPAWHKATVNTPSVKRISNVVGALLRPISASEASLACTEGCSIMVDVPYMSEHILTPRSVTNALPKTP